MRMKPMLAQAIDWDKLSPGSVAEEKFDGHRLLARIENGRVECWSRLLNDCEHKLSPAIHQELMKLPDCTLDGELYIPGGVATDTVRSDLQNELRFVAFDILAENGESHMALPFTIRRQKLLEVLGTGSQVTRASTTQRVRTEQEIVQRAKAVWQRGGEGLIVKSPNARYSPGRRCSAWMKVKRLESSVLTITGFKAGTTGPRCVAVLEDYEGHATKVKLQNNQMLAEASDDWIGRRLRIDHQGRTRKHSYRHPMWDRFETE